MGSRKINRTLNRIRTIFQKETADIREQEEYYGQMLDKAKTGIVVLESGTDSVLYTNKQALILLGVSSLSTLRQLDIVSPSLRGAFEKVEEGLDQKRPSIRKARRRTFPCPPHRRTSGVRT